MNVYGLFQMRTKYQLRAEAKYIKDLSIGKLIDLLEEIKQSDLEILEGFVMIDDIENEIQKRKDNKWQEG